MSVESISEQIIDWGVATMGKCDSDIPGTWTWCETQSSVRDANQNENVVGYFIKKGEQEQAEKHSIVVEDPKYDFIQIHNYLHHIGFYPVSISSLGRNSIIHPTAIIGEDGTEFVRTGKAVFRAVHDGGVQIGNNTKIHSYVSVKWGIFQHDTIIGNNCTIGSFVNVGHNTKIGHCTFIAPGTNIAGWTKIGNDCFIGVGTSIRHNIEIGSNVKIGHGSVICEDIPSNTVVYGNPARPR